MNKRFSIPILLSIFFLGNVSNASELIYPCNLAIKRSVEPSRNSSPQTPNGESVAGNTGGFYARVQIEDRLADANSPLRSRWVTLTAPKTGEWIQLLPASSEFQYNLSSVEFPASLETLGLSYQLSFCYAGPVSSAAKAGDPDVAEGSYDLVGTLKLGDEVDQIPYQGSASVSCDLRNAGTARVARGVTEVNPGVMEPDLQFSINLGRLTSGQMSFDAALNSQGNQVPRFCKISVQVDEAANGVRPNQLNLNEAQITLQIDKNLR